MAYEDNPKTGDNGLTLGAEIIPSSVPASYVPARGETGFADGSLFLPIEPPYRAPIDGDFPIISTRLSIPSRAFPWIEQSGMNVATPCIAPHDWSLAAALRTMILDTTPDATATEAEKAVPGYVANPGLRFASKTHADYDLTKFDDADGVAYIYAFTPDAHGGSFVVGVQYKILTIGTTDFTAIGAASNTVGVLFTATGAGSGTGTAQAVTPLPAALPHPLLRTGQTRYSYPAVAKVGTEWDGVATLPQASPVNGIVSVCAYRYGLLLSANANWPVRVKIGKANATWDKAAKTLTLSSDTTGAVFKYKKTGETSWTDYSAPIAVPSSTVVTWYALHPLMVDSDEWDTAVTYDGAAAPDDFETFYFSALPSIGALENTEIDAALLFQTRPQWYISPAGTGAGLVPASPSNAETIIGIVGAATAGLALGPRSILASVSGAYIGATAGEVKFTTAGAIPSGALIQYATGAYINSSGMVSATWATYSAPFQIDAPGRIHIKLTTSTDEQRSKVFVQPWFMGPANINAVWDATAKTVALTYEPEPLEAEDMSLLYSVDGSAPSLPYSAPIQLANPVSAGAFEIGSKYKITVPGDTDFTAIGAADNNIGTVFTATGAGTGTGVATEADDVTVKSQAIHTARETKDFATASNIVDLTEIDPNATANFDEDHAIMMVAAPGTITHKQAGDVVWCSEGTYTAPGTSAWGHAGAVTIKGGYNSAFTERDVKNRKTIFTGGSPISFYLSGSGVADGLWFDPGEWTLSATSTATHEVKTYTIPILFSGYAYNCHIDLEEEFPQAQGSAGGTSSDKSEWVKPTVAQLLGGTFHGGSISLDLSTPASEAGATGPASSSTSYGGSGGASSISVKIFGTSGSGGSSADTEIDIDLSAGAGGSGGAGGAVSDSSFGAIVASYGGRGGASECSLDAITLYGFGSVSVVAGAGGNGGAGGSATAVDTSGFIGAEAGSNGGAAAASTAVASVSPTEEIAVDCIAGNGGNGGNGGACSATPFGYELPVPTIGAASSSTGTAPTLTVEAGNGGNGGTSSAGGAAGGSTSAIGNVAGMPGDVRPALSVSVTSGNGGSASSPGTPGSTSAVCNITGSSSLYDVTATIAVACGSASSPGTARSGCAWDLSPVYFDDGNVDITESNAYGAGNPIRVNAATTGAGWYSGTPNGDGAPIAGYETPQGSGVALGRYWD